MISRECPARENVLAGEVREVSEDLLLGHPRSQVVQDIVDRHAQATDARLTATLPRLKSDAAPVVHASTLGKGWHWVKRSRIAAQNSLHATGYRLVHESLRVVFPAGSGFEIRGQLPLALSDDSEPEPDLAVVRGGIRDFRDHHPATAVLVVEVADSSLLRDRKKKVSLYARAGIPEYWILNLIRRSLEVYRDPGEGTYRSRTTLRAGAYVTPLAQPTSQEQVNDLLP